MLASCIQGNHSDLQLYVNDVQSKKYAVDKPITNSINFEDYTYDSENMRDPFVPIRPEDPGGGICQNIVHERDVLESLPLETLAYVGSLQQNNEYWALISTHDGTVYRRKTDDYIGNNNGRITKITESSIELLEKIWQKNSGCIDQTTVLTFDLKK